MKFQTIGHRRRPDCGVTYSAIDAPYTIYHSDQLYGMAISPERWLAIYRTAGFERVIGRKKSRTGAERCCNRHARALARAAREAELATKARKRRKRSASVRVRRTLVAY